MYLSLLFWFSLLLPGYVVLRRVSEVDLESGLLGAVGLSYLAVFALLTPISLACYVFHAPLWVFSSACAVAVFGGAIEVTRRGWWRDIGRLLAAGVCLELLVVVADMVMGARFGAFLGGDAMVHLARIRVLLDHGFNNYDPFVDGQYFFPIYHTGLYHALYAACSHLTGISHVGVWFASLSWAKLLIASGAYYMVWCIFERRWVAWVATVFMIGCQGPMSFAVYPNKLAPLWIVPVMIGFAIQACRSPSTWISPLKLGVGSLVLGQVHSLYGAFAGIVLGPVLSVAALVSFWHRRAEGWRLATCVVALTAALPFLLVSKFTLSQSTRASSTASAPATQAAAPADTAQGRVTMEPRAGWGTVRGWRPICLAGGIVCALAGRRRRQAGVLLAVAGTAALVFYVPPLCATVLGLFGKKWILSRLGFVLTLGFVGLVPASVAFLVEPRTRYWWIRSCSSVLVLLFAAVLFKHDGPDAWREYLAKAAAPRAVRERGLVRGEANRVFLESHIPPGATVLAGEWRGMVLVALYDCHIVAPRRSSMGIPDLKQRRLDLDAMLDEDTPWETRRRLLRQYDIRYFVPQGTSMEWTKGHLKASPIAGSLPLLILETDP